MIVLGDPCKRVVHPQWGQDPQVKNRRFRRVVPNSGHTFTWHQLDFSVFSELCGWHLQQWDPAVNLWRAACCLSNSLVCLGIPMGLLRQISQLDVTQSWFWKPHLVTKQSGGILSPSLFGDSIYIAFIFVHILESFFYIRFPYCPSMSLNFNYLSPYSFPQSPSLLLSPNLSSYTAPHPSTIIYFISRS